MIRITKKPTEGQKRMTLDEVHEFVAECEHAGIPGTTQIEATVSVLSKLKSLAAEG